MAVLRRFLCALLVLPVLLVAASASGQLLSADVNGDGARDGIEAGRVPAELVVRLARTARIQRLRAVGAILSVAVADVNHDGYSDLIATTRGLWRVHVVIWTNSGRGRFVSRIPRPRHATVCDRAALRRLVSTLRAGHADELCGDAGQLFVLPSIDLRGQAMASVPVALSLHARTTHARYGRRSPRGPPSTLLSS